MSEKYKLFQLNANRCQHPVTKVTFIIGSGDNNVGVGRMG